MADTQTHDIVDVTFPRSEETLNVRAECRCGEKFEDNDRQTVMDWAADHLIYSSRYADLFRD